MRCGFGMQNDRDPRECKRNLFEQLQPFSGHRQLEIGQARDIATRPCQALNEAAARSATCTKTMGTVRVCCSTAATTGLPVARITSGDNRTSSSA